MQAGAYVRALARENVGFTGSERKQLNLRPDAILTNLGWVRTNANAAISQGQVCGLPNRPSPTPYLLCHHVHVPPDWLDWLTLLRARYPDMVVVDPIETKFGCCLQVAVGSRTRAITGGFIAPPMLQSSHRGSSNSPSLGFDVPGSPMHICEEWTIPVQQVCAPLFAVWIVLVSTHY